MSTDILEMCIRDRNKTVINDDKIIDSDKFYDIINGIMDDIEVMVYYNINKNNDYIAESGVSKNDTVSNSGEIKDVVLECKVVSKESVDEVISVCV